MKKIILLIAFLAKAVFSFGQLSDGSIAPDWTLNDISGNKHQLFDYLNKDKAVVLHFATASNNAAWVYHKTNALGNFYRNNGPSSTHYRAEVFWIESDASNNVACIYGSNKACIGSTKGNWTSGVTFPFLDNATLKTTYQVTNFPYNYLVCPNKKIYSIGLLNETDLETTMQMKCASPLVPLSYSVSLVRDNDCFGDKNGLISLSTSGGVPPYNYVWSNGETYSLITKKPAGVYTCTITDSKGTTLVTNPINILQNNAIDLSSDITKIQACGSKGEIKLKIKGGVPNYSILWDNGATTNSIKNISSPGNYVVSVTDSKGCKIADTINIEVFDNVPRIFGDSIKTLTCTQNSVNFEPIIMPTIGNYKYLWTNNKGEFLSNTLNLLDITLPNIFNLSVIDLNSQCSENKKFEVFQEKAVPLVDFGVVKDLYCDNKLTVIKPSVSGGNSFYYKWEVEENGIFKSLGILDSIIVNAAGVYYVTVTNSETGCAKATKQKVDFWKNPNLKLTLSNPILCFGDSSAVLNAIVSDGKKPFQFNWSNGTMNTEQLKDLKQGVYHLSITDANGCKIVASDTVTSPPKLSLSYKQVNPTNSLSNNGAIDLSILGGTPLYQFTWRKSITIVSSDEDLSDLSIGTYRVAVVDNNNCKIVSTAIILTAPVSTEDSKVDDSIQTYPNPIDDVLLLDFHTNEVFDLEWQLVDNLGIVLQKEYIGWVKDYEQRIRTAQLSSGVYYIIVSLNGKQSIRKVIKL